MALDSPPSLEISGLTRRHGRANLLDGLDLSVEAGSLTAILGPAGSGKSLLLCVLSGLERARGTIMLGGQEIGRLPAYRRGFGVVLQNDALFSHLTLAGNVAFPLRARGVNRGARARLVAEALDLLHLTPCAGRMPAQLTLFEHRRAMLARAIVAAPRLLLLDEPFAGLEAAERAAMIAGLRQIHRLLGSTTLLATRSGADAIAVADCVAVLRDGAVEQQGTPEEVFDRPRNDTVASLLGEMNRLSGRVIEAHDDIAVVRLACGPRVEALLGPALQPGDPCVLTLRPDRIAVAPVDAADMGEGAIDATLIEAQFLGDSYRLQLLIGSGAEVIVRRPAAAGLRGMVPGRTAAIAWQPHHASAFRIENRTGPMEDV